MCCRHCLAAAGGHHRREFGSASLPAATAITAMSARRPQPDWRAIHRELRRPGVTLHLLWEEHRAVHPDGYGYSRYSELYRAWEARLSPTMRQSHVAGERLFVDYAGTTLEVIDASTGVAKKGGIRADTTVKRGGRSHDDQ
jgi:transposase